MSIVELFLPHRPKHALPKDFRSDRKRKFTLRAALIPGSSSHIFGNGCKEKEVVSENKLSSSPRRPPAPGFEDITAIDPELQQAIEAPTQLLQKKIIFNNTLILPAYNNLSILIQEKFEGKGGKCSKSTSFRLIDLF